MTDGHLLIAWHGRTGTSEALAASAAEGAAANGSLLPAADVTPDDLLAAGGYLFVCPENLASMSGEMKEMFDRCYYPVLGKLNGRPFATIIAAGSDGEGAQRQIDRIAKGWRLKRVAEPWIVNTAAQSPEAILAAKTLEPATLQTARDMGEALGEAVTSGML
ncbi:MAG: flavodoxin [Erythrobacter sp.]|nr:flavodoxin [Erythrobacter sp.]